MLLSHRKYKQLVDGFSEHVHDAEVLEKLLSLVREVTNYSEEKSNYSREAYDRLKAKRAETGDTSWKEVKKQYYQTNKEVLNKKRNEYRQLKRQETNASDLNV